MATDVIYVWWERKIESSKAEGSEYREEVVKLSRDIQKSSETTNQNKESLKWDPYAEKNKEIAKIFEEFQNGLTWKYKWLAQIKINENKEELKIKEIRNKVKLNYIPNTEYLQYTDQDSYFSMVLQYTFIVSRLSPYKDSKDIINVEESIVLPFISSFLHKWDSYAKNYEDYKLFCDKLLGYYDTYVRSLEIFNTKCQEKAKQEFVLKWNDYESIDKKLLIIEEFYQTNKYKNKNINELTLAENNEITTLIHDKELIKIRNFEKNFSTFKKDFYAIWKSIVDYSLYTKSNDLIRDINWLLMKAEMFDFSEDLEYKPIVFELWDYKKIMEDYEKYKKNNSNVVK